MLISRLGTVRNAHASRICWSVCATWRAVTPERMWLYPCPAQAISSSMRRYAASWGRGGASSPLARDLGRRAVPPPPPLDRPIVPQPVAEALAADPGLSHVGLIYSETSTGILHDPEAIGAVVRAA